MKERFQREENLLRLANDDASLKAEFEKEETARKTTIA